VLRLPVRTYFRQAFLLPLMLCAPLVVVLLMMRHWFIARNYFQLSIQLLAGSAIYSVGLLWAILTHKIWQVEGFPDQDAANQAAVAVIETYQQEEA
jgi:hypothetical protein